MPKLNIPEFEDPALLKFLNEYGIVKTIKKGDTLMDIGQFIKYIPILLEGSIKVMREDENGDELLLYFLYPGQTCSITLNCCQAQTKSQIKAIAEEDGILLMIPAERMETLTSQFKSWLRFVLRSYNERFNELLQTVDSIAFKQMDQRLLAYLNEKRKITGQSLLRMTHQEIAYDLHSSREVISRLLKQLEKIGTVKLSRNTIELL